MTTNSNNAIIIWLLTGCVLIFFLIIVGGITRLTHSGLSMVEWNLIIGSVPPMNDQSWQSVFDKYKQFPEFKELNYYFTLKDFKYIFWWEYIHRMFGRMIGVVFLLPFFYFLVKKRVDKVLLRKLIIIFLLGAFQGFLGWFMVKSGLVNVPRISHYRLAAHLITAFLVCGYTFWVALDLIFLNAENKTDFSILRKLTRILSGILILQILYGALVAGLRAGLVHNTFPMMDGQWIADSVTVLKPVWKNFINGMSGVQFIHRYLAYAIVIIAGAIWWKSRNLDLDRNQHIALMSLILIVAIQFLLGVLTLLFVVPVVLAILHQAAALLLFLVTLFFIHRLRNQREVVREC